MWKKKTWMTAAVVCVCILLNIIGKICANIWHLPVWLDAYGTILAAYLLGPVCGAMVGASVNLMYGVISSDTYIYVICSVSIGITAGILGKRKMFDTLYNSACAGMIITLVSMLFSVPLNVIFYEGMTGNMWGDGVILYLRELEWNNIFTDVIGEFYVDFLDKILAMFVLYALLTIYRKYFRPRMQHPFDGKKGGALLLALMIGVGAMGVFPDEVHARTLIDKDYGSYVQMIYNADDGIPGGEVNDITQTRDGILWLGTYGGLYKYDGTNFIWMEHFDSVRNVNCLYTDAEGRLWIGTNDGGVSICANDEIVNVLDEENGLPSNSVRSMILGADGNYYVGTTDALAVVSIVNGVHIVDTIDEIVYAVSSAKNDAGDVAVVDASGDLFLLRNGKIVNKYNCDPNGAGFTSVCIDQSGVIYLSTSDNRIWKGSLSNGICQFEECYETGLEMINSLVSCENGRIYVCSDTGAGYLTDQGQFYLIPTGSFTSSIDHMLMDYQGNLWFASSRLGLLKLSESVFCDVYDTIGMPQSVVNTAIRWNNIYYFGTDQGLDATNLSHTEKLTNSLTEALEGIRVRCLKEDSKGNLWISTSGKGIWCVDKLYRIQIYNSENGLLGEKCRSTLELSDGTIACASDLGISFIKNNRVVSTLGEEDGLANSIILCMLEDKDGTIYAGTDGGGIAVIRDGQVEKMLRRSDGLSSHVILRLVKSINEDGIYIVQSNGIAYMDKFGKITVFDHMPYYNNYDIIPVDKYLWITGSNGIYIINEEQLLHEDTVDYELLDVKCGLHQTLTANAWNYQSDNGMLYLAGNTGAIYVNTKIYGAEKRSYRISVGQIKVDGINYQVVSDQDTVIGRDASKVEIYPMVINYSVNNPYVKVYLEDFDEQPQIMQQSELSTITYTNLPSGTYVFHLAVLDNKKQRTIEESTIRIVKEANIYDHVYFKVYLAFVLAILIIFLTSLFIRNNIQKTIELQRKEIENMKLQKDAQAAETASKVKSDFLAQMSHEIRTPINAVLGMNELILRETKEKTIFEYANNIEVAGRNLLTLINGILDFSKIEDGKMEIIPVEYDLAPLIGNITHAIYERAKAKGLKLDVVVDETIPERLFGDDVRITQVITNLLTNAVKYTEKGSVKLEFRKMLIEDGMLELYVEVKDTGIGIREEDLPALFESFKRLDEKRNRNIEGTGLGMSIVTGLLGMMGSKLQVESVYGEGSTFSFVIEQKIISAKPIGVYHDTVELDMEAKQNQKMLQAENAKILVTDDNTMNIKVASGLLKKFAIKCDSAYSGEETIELVKQKTYDIIFLDHMMPKMDGIETLTILKEQQLITDQTKVIALTANAIVGAEETYLAAGFDDYLSKPIDMGKLEELLHKYLDASLISYTEKEVKKSR